MQNEKLINEIIINKFVKDFILDLISVHLDYIYFYITKIKKIKLSDITLELFLKSDHELNYIIDLESYLELLVRRYNSISNEKERINISSLILDYLLDREIDNE